MIQLIYRNFLVICRLQHSSYGFYFSNI